MFTLSKKAKIITALIIIAFIAGLSAFLFFTSNFEKESSVSNIIQNERQKDSKISSPPTPEFSTWIEESSASADIKNTSEPYIYGFKKGYSQDEKNALASSFSLESSSIEEYGGVTSYSDLNPSGGGVLMFNKYYPSFFYTSTEGIPISSNSRSGVANFIQDLTIFDESVQITATYQRRSEPDITYYELHRSWNEFGYPIYNPFGLLNIPEEQSLQTLSYTTGNTQLDVDTDIYNTSDSKDGFRRETDFNTVLVAVNQKTNKIIKVESNIRPIETEVRLTEKNSLISKEDAIEHLQNGELSLFFTLPSGGGVLDLNKVYPNNAAKGKDAVIQEATLAYLEKPAGVLQSSLEPYYVFKGYSMLDSGYRVRFIAAVSAISNKTFPITFDSKPSNIAGVKTVAQIGGQQQDTLNFPTTQKQSPTPIPTIEATSIPTNTTAPTVQVSQTQPTVEPTIPQPTSSPQICTDPEAPVILNTFEYERITFALGVDPIEYKTYSFYFFPTQEWKNNIADQGKVLKKLIDYIQNVSNEFIVNIPEDWKINSDTRNTLITKFENEQRNIDKVGFYHNTYDFSKMDYLVDATQLCPIRITGRSPSMFIYGADNASYRISINTALTYTDPKLNQNNWQVVIYPQGQLSVNNVIRNYLYYEYEPISFDEPIKGWVVLKRNLAQFSSNLAQKMKLNALEEERLYFELHNQADSINKPYLFIGILSDEEVNSKIPIHIYPNIDNIQRYHFYIKGTDKQINVMSPTVKPVIRTNEMILEFGATSNN